jgi:Transposase
MTGQPPNQMSQSPERGRHGTSRNRAATNGRLAGAAAMLTHGVSGLSPLHHWRFGLLSRHALRHSGRAAFFPHSCYSRALKGSACSVANPALLRSAPSVTAHASTISASAKPTRRVGAGFGMVPQMDIENEKVRKPRQRFSAEEKADIVGRVEGSGLRRTEFCRREGVSLFNLQRWLGKWHRESGAARFVEAETRAIGGQGRYRFGFEGEAWLEVVGPKLECCGRIAPG